MNSLFKKLTLFLILAGLFVVPGLAQTAMTATTVTTAVTINQTALTLASITGVTVGDLAVIDAEAMRVNSISGDVIFVSRGFAGTKASKHASSSDVLVDPPAQFTQEDRVGLCTAGSEFPNFEPLINLTNGKRFRCLESNWTTVWDSSGQLGEIYVTWSQGAASADAVSTIFWVAPRAMRVTDIDAVWDVAESTGNMDIQVQKLVGTEAIASGDDLVTVINATGTANTTNNFTLSTTAAFLELAAGDKLAVELTATPNEIVGLTVTIRLVPDSN